MNYPADIDQECILLCDALNALPGISTISSCCGHGNHPHRIFFESDTVLCLAPILRNVTSSGWDVTVRWSNGNDSIHFVLEGPVGPAAMPGGANDLAQWIAVDRQ